MPPEWTSICETCRQKFKSRRLAAHQKACRRDATRMQEDLERQNARAGDTHISMNLEVCLSNDHVLPPAIQQDDIRTEYHPRSGIPTKTDHFADFRCNTAAPSLAPENTTPWEPFSSCIDFDFAELILKANLTKLQMNELIGLIHRAALERFSVTDYDGICKLWDAASSCHAKFKKEVISVPHRDQEHNFDVWYRPLWDWTCDLLKDPRLGPHFVFDAQRLYKFDRQDFVCFFDEPWTANAFWDCQSSLPKDEGKPFAFIIYADKAKLSSFGHQKVYPVIARCANLPVGIRNGEGFSGGRLVGWLSIVEEDRKYSRTQSFVNFKNVIWHESFKRLLKSIALLSKTSCWVMCWDNIKCLFYPLILILSADYEEQCVMALIHGTKCKCPCPICLVPREELGNVLTSYPLRTSTSVQATITEARSFSRQEDKEKLLMSQGLRDVDYVAHTDVHSAVSFDRLHVNNKGNFSDHLWTQFQERIKSVGRQIQSEIDVHFDSMPCWRNINHFKHVMDISFSDSSKYEDISKLIVFAAHDIIDRGTHTLPYLLLQCIHEYVNINMYAALEVHTSETIAVGHLAITEFTQLLEVSFFAKDDSGKNWAYPKRHAYAHLFDDIEAKGAMWNTNTKPNEKCVLCLDHRFLIAHSIHLDIEDYDDLIASQKDPSYLSSADNDEDLDNDLDITLHVKLGAEQNEQTFAALEQEHASNNAFNRFRIKLANFLSDSLPAHGILLPGGKRIKFMPDETVTEHCFVKVNYDPSFHNFPRYDCVILQTQAGVIFGHLLMLFTCVVDGQTHPVALVHPYDALVGQRSLKDKHFQFWRVRQRLRISSKFFLVHSIIHGAALAEDHSIQGDYLVIDTIDTDMFLCMKVMHKSAGHVE
ncbi:uncharacterized protein EDB93DRAFT_1261699 [Suillus bovinus]|uniref:uncharacterized protein n=1 Tax=Suillus bovinus TaxID=48563 RepID=UPI001B8757CE|nr:uncharacterized protein EDB93DRAFT_1261699 [Suillus bovinus]KAG2160202.1 hypothetical protein EDB93DRAFT_1261699 [Suillus bovinus]